MFWRRPQSAPQAGAGVLPLDVILAEEHDRIHGDTVRVRQDRISLLFTVEQVRNPAAIARMLRDARVHALRRAASLDHRSEGETPLDRSLQYILGGEVDASDPTDTLLRSLTDYAKARGRATQQGVIPEGSHEPSGEMVAALLTRLNELVEQDHLAARPAFAHLVDGDALAQLGEEEEANRARQLANRLLLESVFRDAVTSYRELRLQLLFASVRETDTAALCLSGGGIRSATFALGVIQGLARKNVLGKFDYLSTVSGGGYIGAWLSSWMCNAGPDSVHADLSARTKSVVQPEPAPLRYLRTFARYLSPRTGLLSSDTWTLLATIIRNLLLNWLVLLPLLAAMLFLPRLAVELLRTQRAEIIDMSNDFPLSAIVGTGLGLILLTCGLATLHLERASLTGTKPRRHRLGLRASLIAAAVAAALLSEPYIEARTPWALSEDAAGFIALVGFGLVALVVLGVIANVAISWLIAGRVGQPRTVLAYGIGPIVAGIAALSTSWYVVFSAQRDYERAHKVMNSWFTNSYPGDPLAAAFDMLSSSWDVSLAIILIGTGVQFTAWFVGAGRRRGAAADAGAVLVTSVVGAMASLAFASWSMIQATMADPEVFQVTFGVPAYLLILLLGTQLWAGLSGTRVVSAETEWWARINAWLMIAIMGWLAFAGLALFGARLLDTHLYDRWIAGLGGISGVITLLLGGGSRTPAMGRAGPASGPTLARRLVLSLAAPVFACILIVTLARADNALIESACAVPHFPGCDVRDEDRRIRAVETLARERVADQHRFGEQLSFATGIDAALESLLSNVPDRFRSPDWAQDYLNGRRTLADGRVLHDSSLARERRANWPTEARQLLQSLTPGVTSATASAHEVDRSLVERSHQYTALVLQADSTLGLSNVGNVGLWDSFLDRRTFVYDNDRKLADHLANRATSMSSAMLNASSLWQTLDSTVTDTTLIAEAHAIADRVRDRVESGLGTEEQLRADSVTRARSEAVTSALLLRAVTASRSPLAAAQTTAVLILLLLLFALLLGNRIDSNRFSLHGMYRSRLVRTFLGASRDLADRVAHPFTGFDVHDDLPIGQLWPGQVVEDVRKPAGRPSSRPPFHIVNVALNLVAGRNLAWQQRKAEPMTITPLHAGSHFLGYRRTSVPPLWSGPAPALYGGGQGITLGTAITISGAAASPNAGYHSSPLVTFLMTIFNARLGWWLGNPGAAGATTFDRHTPQYKLLPVLNEMFGLTTDRSRYVYLSDGGHFENLGLYEAVLRRCRFIVVSDAGCDPTFTFEDLGNAVRKVRVDLGIPIEFPNGVGIHARGDVPGEHVAIGRVRYSAVDMPAGARREDEYDGVLIYLKPVVYGKNEPHDVINYSATRPDFPHESTADQFFTESQFESYRQLGEYTALSIFEAAGAQSTVVPLAKRAGSLLSQWPHFNEPGRVAAVPLGEGLSPMDPTLIPAAG